MDVANGYERSVLNDTRRHSARMTSALRYCAISRPKISRDLGLSLSAIGVSCWLLSPSCVVMPGRCSRSGRPLTI
jgi:hypothetical protein